MADSGFNVNMLVSAADSIFDNIVTTITGDIAGFTANLLSGISVMMAAALPVYFIFRIMKMWLFHHKLNMLEFVYDILIMALLSAFTYSGSLYTSNVVDFVMGSGDSLAASVTGSSGHTALTTMFSGLVQAMADVADTLKFGMFKAPIKVILLLIAVIIGFITAVLFFVECLGYLLLAKLMAGICLSVGGLFICLAFFPVTRPMFFAWIKMCISYIMLTFLMTIGCTILVKVITGMALMSSGFGSGISAIISTILVLMMSNKLVHQIPELASRLSDANMSVGGGKPGVMSQVGGAALAVATGGASKVAGKVADAVKGVQGGIGKG